MSQAAAQAFLAKVEEQIERVEHMIARGSGIAADWTPPLNGARPLSWLLGHLVECLAGFCAVLYAAYPAQLAHFQQLREEPVNVPRPPAEALAKLTLYRERLREGFASLQDSEFERRIPTVFVPEGEALLTLLLGNFEHLVSHKYQLGVYLKLAGVELGSRDFYRFR
jgi:hypothetical protein